MNQNIFGNDGEIPEQRILRKVEIDPILAHGLNFTAEDLATNRQGMLSARQQKILTQVDAQPDLNKFPTRFIQGLMVVGIIIGWFVSSLEAGRENLVWFGAIVAIFILATLLFGWMLLFVLHKKFLVRRNKLIETRVQSQTGVVILDSGITSRGATQQQYHRFTLNDQTFNISREGFLRFKHLERYIIYYLPKSKIIVSAEPAE